MTTVGRLNVLFASAMVFVFNQSGMRTQMEAFAAALSERHSVGWYQQREPYVDPVDCLHVFTQDPSVFNLAMAFERRGTRVVVSPNAWIRFHWRIERALSRLDLRNVSHIIVAKNLARKLFDIARFVTCNTEAEGMLLQQIYDVPTEKLLLVRNGIYVDKYAGDESLFRERWPQIGESFFLTVGGVGSLRKNHHRLFEQWRRDFPDLVVVGYVDDTDYGQRCRLMAEQKDNIHLLGPLPNQSPLLVSAFHAASCFLAPGLVETPSIAAMEALTCGTPVIVTARGGAEEYFSSFGRYIEPEAAGAIEREVERFMVDPIDASGGTEYMREHYDWSITTRPLLKAYESFCD